MDETTKKLFDGIRSSTFYDRHNVARALIEKGANVNASDHEGNRPLHHAAAAVTRPNTVLVLLEAGAKVDARNKRGETALHKVAPGTHGYGGITARYLLDYGADPNAMDNQGLRPIDRARESGSLHTVEMLEAAMRDVEGKLVTLSEQELQKRHDEGLRLVSLLDAELKRRREKNERSR